jgi:lipopolysaccharide transport system ATP-binding protein
MGAVANLCPNAILLEAGRVAASGPTGDIIKRYYHDAHLEDGTVDLRHRRDRTGSGTVRLNGLWFENASGQRVQYVGSGETVDIVLQYETPDEFVGQAELLVNVVVSNARGNRLFGLPSDVTALARGVFGASGTFRCRIERLPLMPGNYELDVACLRNRELADKVMGAASLVVVEGRYHATGRLPLANYGDMLVDYAWSMDDAPTHSWRGDAPFAQHERT